MEKLLPVILDGDPGHDDAIAWMLAKASPLLDIRAVTSVCGNQTIEKTTYNAQRVCALLGIDAPVAMGKPAPLLAEPMNAPSVHGQSGLDGPVLPEPNAPLSPLRSVALITPRAFAACVLRHAGAAGPPLFRGLLQLPVFLKNFKIFFDHFLLSRMHENWHGYLFPTGLNFLIRTSRRCRDFVAHSARRCQGDSVALSWCCHIVLYIYAENSTLGLKTVYRWQ